MSVASPFIVPPAGPAATLPGVVESAAFKFTQNTGADFLSLLNISSARPDLSQNANAGDDAPSQPHKNYTPQNAGNNTAPDPQNDSATPVRIVKPDAPSIQKMLESASAHPSGRIHSHPSDRNESADSGNNAASNAASGDATASDIQADDALKSQKQLRAAIGDALSTLDQLLASIIQSLTPAATAIAAPVTAIGAAGAAGAAVAPSLDPSGLPVVPVSAAAPDPLQIPPAATPSDPSVADAATATVSTPAGELSLLQDIRSLVEQLQQTLTATAGGNPQAASPVSVAIPGGIAPMPSAPAVTTANTPVNNPASPDDLLDRMLAKLSQFTQGQNQNNNLVAATPAVTDAKIPAPVITTPVAGAVSVSPANPQPAVDSSALASMVADVHQQVQKLKEASEAVFSQVKNTAPVTAADPTLSVKDASQVDFSVKDNAAQVQISYAGAVAPAPQTPTLPANGGTQNEVLFTAGVALVQQASDNSANTNSGDSDQQQPQAAAVIQPASAQAPANAAGGASFARMLQQAAPAPLLEQVTFNVKTALTDGSSKITIQLHPADLGKVDIRLNVDASGKTSVVITADNHATLDLLQRDAQGLSRALNDAGLQTDSGSFSFNLGGHQQGSGQNNTQGNAPQSVSTYQKMQPPEETEVDLTIISRNYSVNLTDGLDIKI